MTSISNREDPVVTNVTFLLWPMILNPPTESTEFQNFCDLMYNGYLQVHECVLDGPDFNPEKTRSEPYLTYFFEDVGSLFDWLCLHTSSSIYLVSIRKLYEWMEHCQTMKKMNQALQEVTLKEIRIDLLT